LFVDERIRHKTLFEPGKDSHPQWNESIPYPHFGKNLINAITYMNKILRIEPDF